MWARWCADPRRIDVHQREPSPRRARTVDPASCESRPATGTLQRHGGDAMSAGLFGLLDDVAALARLAAASGRASAKAAGVVIDDTAVTPQYVLGITAERELPIIKRIAMGSLRNKLLLILPITMLLSQFAPRLV